MDHDPRRLACACLIVLGLLLPRPARADDHIFPALLGASMVLHGTDVAESMFLFGRYPQQFHEGNPLLRPFQERPVPFGLVKTGLAAGINLGLYRLHKTHPKAANLALLLSNVGIGAVVIANARTSRQGVR